MAQNTSCEAQKKEHSQFVPGLNTEVEKVVCIECQRKVDPKHTVIVSAKGGVRYHLCMKHVAK